MGKSSELIVIIFLFISILILEIIGGNMLNIIELPPIEKWDSNNEELYHYEYAYDENGEKQLFTFKMPFPTEQVFYRRRKIPENMINKKQYNECKYCGKVLVDGYWRRMGYCRICHQEEPWAKKLF